MIETLMSGNPSSTIRSNMTDKFKNDDHNNIESQAVIHSNSKTNTEGSLLTMATKVLRKTHKQNTFADSLTGGDGIKRKTCTVAAITNYTKKYNVDTEIVLNKTRDVVGTEAMNAGVSSEYMEYFLYRGSHQPICAHTNNGTCRSSSLLGCQTQHSCIQNSPLP